MLLLYPQRNWRTIDGHVRETSDPLKNIKVKTKNSYLVPICVLHVLHFIYNIYDDRNK